MNLKIEMSGIDTIDDDFLELQKRIGTDISKTMPYLAEVLKSELKNHIEEDVYSVYSPTVYKRRSENPELGTPLNEIDANTVIDISKDSAQLEYNPTGEHAYAEGWIPLNGDPLIRRIETGRGYDFDFDMERPFFRNFVGDMIEGGIALQNFIEIINNIDPELDMTDNGAGAIRDGKDWNG